MKYVYINTTFIKEKIFSKNFCKKTTNTSQTIDLRCFGVTTEFDRAISNSNLTEKISDPLPDKKKIPYTLCI